MSNFKANLAASWRPKSFQNRRRNLKKSMLENNTLLASIFKGLASFWQGFWLFSGTENACQKRLEEKCPTSKKYWTKPIRNRCRRSCNNGFFEHNRLINRMFVGTSISEAFWKDFGRVLGGRNPQFSHFFRHLFEANFGRRFGRPKNRVLKIQHWKLPHFWAGPAECAEPGGEIERG